MVRTLFERGYFYFDSPADMNLRFRVIKVLREIAIQRIRY